MRLPLLAGFAAVAWGASAPGQEPAPRLALGQGFARGETVDLPLHERREHPTRADGVARDGARRGFERDDLGQPEETVLRRDVGGLVHGCDEPVRGGDIDDATPAAALHAGQGGTDGVECG